MIYNISSREILYKINEHSEEKIVSTCAVTVLNPKLLLMTTGNDNSLRFWSFNLAKYNLILKEET